MEYIINRPNTICLFHDLNQGDEKETLNMCSFYAPVINLKYNIGIALTENDIKQIAKSQIEKGKFSYTDGGYGDDGVNAVYQFVKDNAKNRGWIIPNLAITKTDSELNTFIKLGYAVMIGIKVNKSFVEDIKDFKLDSPDYASYKGNDLSHFTNVYKWTQRGEIDNGNEYILDSYFTKKGVDYKCNIQEILADIDMNTKYIFF